MSYERDKVELEDLIRGYTPVGYRVKVPPLGVGFIEDVLQEYRQRSQYRVRLDKPIPFKDYADEVDASTRKLTADEVRGLFRGMLPPYPEETLERGMSRRDMLRLDMLRTGCLDDKDKVFCIVADWSQLDLAELERGMLVEYSEHHSGEGVGGGTGGIRVWRGRIAGFVQKKENPEGQWPVALIELFEPIRYYRTPQGINNLLIKPGFYSAKSVSLAYGLYEAMEDFDRETGGEILPKKGAWSDDKKEFFLEEPIDVSVVEKFCAENYPAEVHCLLQALNLFILPVNIGEKGDLRPLRRGDLEDHIQAVQVDYEF